ncbi:tetraacyldisaccharide 4'-kinase [Bartonella tamiae]|uniref:Tetraacyldisaccharide 4'-kinase n=1 Tax=Bartonella tamiae Th239 TaxID=1094558 RepID=J0ZQ76_9HYPH|nr:tetraacyldisaccharide 4'-kinase [Bartonella tamiae]EJF90778.1 tetraacyldisaccharide 4'-kinase [Bartonella tamiae Th239]EJF90801.1 tetraacyldisaccharide 4'-kinase [Bartonella tamiae Th239]EJF93405.1 tetraacyldisaccharide 4'-kinase [Bartonella tamiae Th307]EJF93414.1 tetraacyldisaccharide 4'-kinase [Bartonella tamiae Th307]
MVSNTPKFWWQKKSFPHYLLMPLSGLYGFFAARKMHNKVPPKIDLPVLCVGNFTLGGAGKTPVAIALAQCATTMGLKPGIISRGYGRKNTQTRLVNSLQDTAHSVGDEPLLLAQYAPVAVSKNRLDGAKLLQNHGCNFIIMDDGFQSRRIFIDYALLVVDGIRGFGNGAVFPAGPLRAPLKSQLNYTDSIVTLTNEKNTLSEPLLDPKILIPLYQARLKPSATASVENQNFLAFAGIGNPEKFFRSIEELGGHIIQKHVFADHHFYTQVEIDRLSHLATKNNLLLATTLKDYMRLKGKRVYEDLQSMIIFDISVVFDDGDRCQKLIQTTIENATKRGVSLSS